MKKLCFVLCVVCVLSLAGCGKKNWYVPQVDIPTNYNNVTADDSFFWLTADVCYSVYTPVYATYLTAISSTKKQTLPITSGFQEFFVYHNVLYLLYTENDEISHFHSYNIQTKERKRLFTYPGSNLSYFVLGEHLYYWESYYANGNYHKPLSCHSLIDGATATVSENVITAGVMDNTPVCLVKSDDQIEIIAYDAENHCSSVIGTLPSELDEYGHFSPDDVNFTSDEVVLTYSATNKSTVVCYNLNTQKVSQYALDYFASSIIAYEEYAFIVAVNAGTYGDADTCESIIYRLCLKTGETEEICRMAGMLNTFVASDDCVYVSSNTDSSHIYRYDANGDKTLVCVQ